MARGTPEEKAAQAQRRARVAARIVAGDAIIDIAADMVLPEHIIRNDLRKMVDVWQAEQQCLINEHKTLDMIRINQMFGAIWPACLAGNLLAIDRAVKLLERRAKMLGLNMPEKHEVAGDGAHPFVFRVVYDAPRPDDDDGDTPPVEVSDQAVGHTV